MQPCPVCGATGIDPSGYCVNCGTLLNPGSAGPVSFAPGVALPVTAIPVTSIVAGLEYGHPPSYPTYPPAFPMTPPPARNAWPVALIAVSVAVIVLVVGAITLVALTRPQTDTHAVALPSSSASRSAVPSPSPSLTPQECVVGTWVETSHQHDSTVNGTTIRMAGSGAYQQFHSDGTAILDYGAGITYSGTLDGSRWTVTNTGHVTFRYQITGGTILYTSSSAEGSYTWRENDEVVSSAPISGGSTDPETFTCTGDTMTELTGRYAIELRRTPDT